MCQPRWLSTTREAPPAAAQVSATQEIECAAGAGLTDHVRPFHNSENGLVVSLEELNELADRRRHSGVARRTQYRRLSYRPGVVHAGVGLLHRQLRPSQRSVRAIPLPDSRGRPAAKQSDAFMHATACRSAPREDGSGCGVHLRPSHRAAPWPTAMHVVAATHETPRTSVSWGGEVTADHLRPFHRIATLRWPRCEPVYADVVPTAMQ